MLKSPERTSGFSKSLKGVHGVRVVSNSPFESEDTTRDGDTPHSTFDSSIGGNQRLIMQWVWDKRPGCLRPVKGGCIQGDQTLAETAANVLTSLPFIVLGMHAPRKNAYTKLYANSLIGVGVASSLYHTSRGKLRKYLRWVDYAMIATTTCLTGALRNDNPKFLMAASAFLLPVQPFMVSVFHTGMMEVVFAKRALKDDDLKIAHNVHTMSTLLGGVLFLADDVFPKTQFLHAAWHLAAAVGVGTCNKLLE